jgi:hypothetical protein
MTSYPRESVLDPRWSRGKRLFVFYPPCGGMAAACSLAPRSPGLVTCPAQRVHIRRQQPFASARELDHVVVLKPQSRATVATAVAFDYLDGPIGIIGVEVVSRTIRAHEGDPVASVATGRR